MDYRDTPNARPWSIDVSEGDALTSDQAYCIDETRLRDFGFVLERQEDGSSRVARPASSPGAALRSEDCSVSFEREG